jgi:glutamate-ammonia-ligase adenylyltransferase
MALTRARPIAGDTALRQRMTEAIGQVLRSTRDPERLLADVADMRRRIAQENPRPSPWDLRNRPGGLLDLEFIVQYLMLREAASSPQVVCCGTAAALRELGKAGALPPQACRVLLEALTLLRRVQILLTLLGDGLSKTDALPEAEAATLARCAGAVDFARLDADITAATAQVRDWYRRLIEKPARRAAMQAVEQTGENSG